MAARKANKVHWEIGQTGTTGCGQSVKRRTTSSAVVDVTCVGCQDAVQEASQTKAKPGKRSKTKAATKDAPQAVTVPPTVTEKLEGDALIARKRLAGAGRSAEAGTAFGSRWTDEERKRLGTLVGEAGRGPGVTAFLEAHPHRTRAGCHYQIERGYVAAAMGS